MKVSENRHTKQRQLILDTLRSIRSHPTADELYDMLRQKMPRISLGTVYRNLDQMGKAGLINILICEKGPRRFDGNKIPHFHIRCIECGRMDDVPECSEEQLNEVMAGINNQCGYEVTGFSVEFSGICPQCGNRDKPTPDESGDSVEYKSES